MPSAGAKRRRSSRSVARRAPCYVAHRARLPPHDRRASSSKSHAPADRVDLLARVHVPPEQLGAPRLHVLRPRRDDVPDGQRGALEREGHRRPALSTTRGCSRSASAIFFLMGIGTLFGWKKTSDRRAEEELHRSRRRAGSPRSRSTSRSASALGFPAVVWSDADLRRRARHGASRRSTRSRRSSASRSASSTPRSSSRSSSLLFALARARPAPTKARPEASSGTLGRRSPGFIYTLRHARRRPSRRRYGGYIVHLGIVLMFLGFTGQVVERSTARRRSRRARPTRSSDYTLEYVGPRMEVDNTKRMIFADVARHRGRQASSASSTPGEVHLQEDARLADDRGRDAPLAPRRPLPRRRQHQPGDEGRVAPDPPQPARRRGSGSACIILIFGSIVCMWPELEPAGVARLGVRARSAARSRARSRSASSSRSCPLQRSRSNKAHRAARGHRADRKRARARALRSAPLHVRDVPARAPLDVRVLRRRRNARAAARASSRRARRPSRSSTSTPRSTAPRRSRSRRTRARCARSTPSRSSRSQRAARASSSLLRRWRGKGPPPPPTGGSSTGKADKKRDDLDDRLDEELRDLDG